MSTKPGIPDHFTIHDVRDAAAGSPPAGGGTATRAQLQAMRDLSIPYDSDHPPTFDDAARLIREAEEAENPMRVVVNEPRTLDPNKSYPIDSLEGRQAIGANPPASVDLTEPHVATLPDGRVVSLPAGTVLREGMTWDGPPADPLRDLLRRARPRLVDEPESKRLDGEIVAFLAGMPIVSEGSRPLTLAELCAWATAEAKGIEVTMGDKLDPYLDGKIAALLVIVQFVNEPARLREYMARRGTVAAAGRATFTAAKCPSCGTTERAARGSCGDGWHGAPEGSR